MSANYRVYAFDVTGPRDQADRHIEWQKVYRSVCASACLRPFRSHGKSCCAVGCTNRYEKGANLSFYCFPVEPNRRARWTAAVNQNNWIGVTGTREFASSTKRTAAIWLHASPRPAMQLQWAHNTDPIFSTATQCLIGVANNL